jgi:hypothetical protein
VRRSSQRTLRVVDFLTLLRSDVGCKTVANMIKGKTPEEIRKLFNIVNDFTPEEEVRNLKHYLESSSDKLFVVLQAQIKKENVSCPPCLTRVRIGC